jgi:hypothetical protein
MQMDATHDDCARSAVPVCSGVEKPCSSRSISTDNLLLDLWLKLKTPGKGSIIRTSADCMDVVALLDLQHFTLANVYR